MTPSMSQNSTPMGRLSRMREVPSLLLVKGDMEHSLVAPRAVRAG